MGLGVLGETLGFGCIFLFLKYVFFFFKCVVLFFGEICGDFLRRYLISLVFFVS